MIPAALLIKTFFLFKISYFIVCCLKHSQNFFTQCLALYTSCLFSMLLNDDTVGIEKPDGICFPTFVVNAFLRLFLHTSIFPIKRSQSA